MITYPQLTRYNVFVLAVFLFVVVKKRYQHLPMVSSCDSFLVVRYSCNIWHIKHMEYLCQLKQTYFIVLLVLGSVLFDILKHKLVVSLNT